jgi:anaerobic selenocysteine-containing dehydrogenase
MIGRRLGIDEFPLGSPGHSGRVQAKHVYDAILSGKPYPIKALISFGSDPLIGNGDTLRGKAALHALDFFVAVDIFANPSTVFADILLPASTCWEREALMPSFSTAEETAIWAQLKPAVVPALYESRADIEIVFDLANRLALKGKFFGGDIDLGYDYHLAPSGLTVEQLRANRTGMRAALRTRYQKHAEIDSQREQPRGFQTPTGKLEIYSTRFASAGYPPLPGIIQPDDGFVASAISAEYPLILTSFRLMQFCDQQHRNIPRLRRQAREPLLEMNPETASSLDILDGNWVELETAHGGVKLRAKLNPSLHPKVVAVPYGWWQACRELGLPGYNPFTNDGANVNLIIPNEASDSISGAVAHRSQPCRVRKFETGFGS